MGVWFFFSLCNDNGVRSGYRVHGFLHRGLQYQSCILHPAWWVRSELKSSHYFNWFINLWCMHSYIVFNDHYPLKRYGQAFSGWTSLDEGVQFKTWSYHVPVQKLYLTLYHSSNFTIQALHFDIPRIYMLIQLDTLRDCIASDQIFVNLDLIV